MKSEIRLEKDRAYKEDFVISVLKDLGDWFEHEEATRSYGKKARDLDTFIISKDTTDLGFVMVNKTSEDTIEIYCLGIYKAHHRKGLGTYLLDHVFDYYKKSYKLVQVKTLAEGIDKYYDRTIGFYKKLGFIKLEVMDELWGPDNPCLVMVKSL